jgi:hypothetical protein
VATVPNPSAPEFMIAARTPLLIHRALQRDAFPTHYSFRSMRELGRWAMKAGLQPEKLVCSPVWESYLSRIGSRKWARLGAMLDGVIVHLAVPRLFGACLVVMTKLPAPQP